jgi:hypothetical protein
MARQSQIKYIIPEPCHAPWHSMAAVEKDQRYCSSCEKVVTDFTKMSDDELILYMRHSSGEVCGRLLPSQHNRAMKMLPEKTVKAKWWRTLLLIPLTFFGKQLKAQYYEVKYALEQPDSQRVASEPVLQNDSSETIAENIPANSDPVLNDTMITLVVQPLSETGEMKYVWLPNIINVNAEYIVYVDQSIGGCMIAVEEPFVGFWADTFRTIKENCTSPGPEPEPEDELIGLNYPQQARPKAHLRAPDPFDAPFEKQEEKPKPERPALPAATTDIAALVYIEDKKYKRS